MVSCSTDNYKQSLAWEYQLTRTCNQRINSHWYHTDNVGFQKICKILLSTKNTQQKTALGWHLCDYQEVLLLEIRLGSTPTSWWEFINQLNIMQEMLMKIEKEHKICKNNINFRFKTGSNFNKLALQVRIIRYY